MELEFAGEVVEWRGPPPFYYVVLPEAESETIHELSGALSYGWGAIPVQAQVRGQEFTTSLFPKDGRYLLPLKDAVRRPAGISLGDIVEARLVLTLLA